MTINPNETDVNKSLGSVSIENPGFGYSMPIELKVVGGRPSYDSRMTAPIEDEWAAVLGTPSVLTTGTQLGGNPISRGTYVFECRI